MTRPGQRWLPNFCNCPSHQPAVKFSCQAISVPQTSMHEAAVHRGASANKRQVEKLSLLPVIGTQTEEMGRGIIPGINYSLIAPA